MLVSEQKASSCNSILAAFKREKLQPNPPLQWVLVNHFNDTTWPLLSAQAGVDGYDGSQVTAQQAAATLQTVISSEISTRCLGVLTPEYAPNHLQQLAIPETGTRLGEWGGASGRLAVPHRAGLGWGGRRAAHEASPTEPSLLSENDTIHPLTPKVRPLVTGADRNWEEGKKIIFRLKSSDRSRRDLL